MSASRPQSLGRTNLSGLDGGGFRAALGRFASGVTVVTTTVDGVDHAMTASAFSSVSLDPPLVCVNVDRRNRFGEAVAVSRTWAVSILSETGQHAATWFARRGRPLPDQFDRVAYRRGELTGAPLLDAAVAWLECRTWAEYDGGDHVLLVGEVVGAHVHPERPDSPSGIHPDRPLLYYRSHYAALLRSRASEHSDVTLRNAIIDDDKSTPSSAPMAPTADGSRSQ
jgi:flavin reductase (DIM6/NTAB) family NADH-FMN oxidoreductase RutF